MDKVSELPTKNFISIELTIFNLGISVGLTPRWCERMQFFLLI